MNYFEIIWAITSVIVFLAIIYYNYQILKNFDENEQLSITKVFLSDEGPKAFITFAMGFVIFGLFMLIGALTININDLIYHYGSKIGSFIMFLTWLYFMSTVSKISKPDN